MSWGKGSVKSYSDDEGLHHVTAARIPALPPKQERLVPVVCSTAETFRRRSPVDLELVDLR